MAKSLCSAFIALIVFTILAAGAHAAVLPTTCTIDEVFTACTGSAALCSTYATSGACEAAQGCDWTTSSSDTTPWSEGFSASSDWQPFNNGLSATHHDNDDCINDANDKCIIAREGSDSSTLTKKSNEDLSSCASATFNIAKVGESGPLSAGDCTYVRFSNDGGSTWSTPYTIFCDDNPSSTFQQSIPSQYLTSQFRTQFSKSGFADVCTSWNWKGQCTNWAGKEAYLDGLSVTCTQDTSSCGGTPAACGTYVTDASCTMADGCTSACRDREVCGDGITQSPNDDQVAEACDDGNEVDTDACMNDCTLPVCGDEILSTGEACDDGNNADGDGCSANCAIEINSVCGDGITNGAETCDDGNLADGDGCSSACETTGLCIDEPTIVSNLNAQGWFSYEEIPVGSFLFVDGPGTPPLGTGSAQLIVDTTGREIFGTLVYAGRRLDDITELSYSTYVDTSSSAFAAPSLQLDIDTNLSDANVAWQGRLVYEPYFTHTVTQGTWQTWNTLDNAAGGNWWFSGAPGNGVCPQANPCTWTEVLAAFPDAGLRASVGVLQFKAGGPLPEGMNASVDNFRINDPSQQSCEVYDYEYVPYCGDNIVNGDEACEANDDILEPKHYTCEQCQLVLQPYCGDDHLDEGEECDDGNTENNDGCNGICEVEEFICDPQQQLVLNGGFEAPVVTDGSGWDIYPDGTGGLEWSVEWADAYDGAPEVANAELHRGVNGWIPAEGQQYTELDSDWNGHNEGPNGEQSSVRMYQDLATVPGETYHIRFQFSPRPSTDNTQNVLEFYWDGVLQDTISASGGGNTAWTTHEYDLVATGTTTRIAFEDAGTPNSEGTFLDDVSVLCTPREEEYCPYEVVSDTHTGLQKGGNAQLVAQPYHPAWTASVPGALWVWDGSGVNAVNFTDSVVIAGPVSDALLRVASDNSYRIWINGVLIGSDAEEFNYASGHEEEYDVSAYLHAGANAFVFEVDNWHGPGGLLYKLTYTDVCEQPEEYCGDGIVNQESEQCDGSAPEGYECFKDCTLHMTCEEAIAQHLLTGEIVDGTATVQNDAEDDFVVSLASYEMYAPLIEDQVLFDHDTQLVEGGSSAEFGVELPLCAYQIDLICGEPKETNPDYTEEQKLDFTFGNQEAGFCTPDDQGDASLIVAEGFPQCNNFVFECNVEGFEPTAYYWYFGDGEILPNTTQQNVYHTFTPGEDFTVTCTASDGEHFAADSVDVHAGTCCGDGVVQELDDEQIAEQCDGSAPEQYTCDDSCQLHLTCEGAIQQGLLTGEIVDGTATVQNDADEDYLVSLASYEMYALLIEDQVLFDSDSTTVGAGEGAELSVELPACTYQIDLVCGEPLPFVPLYGDRVIDFHFGNQEADFCTPTQRESDATVTVSVQDGFPQSEEGAAHYVFTCDVDGFVPTGYYWYFGDGELLPNVVNDNVWHTYTENGDYTVACTATNGSEWQTGTLGISVEGIEPPVEPSVSVSVDPYYPQGNAFVFICDTEGFTPTSYDWDFGDGEILYDLLTDDVYHTFDHNGDYTVTCTASDGETSASGSIGVSASACVAYDVAITSVEPNPAAPESTVTVSGTVTESANPGADLSGHTIDVNGQSVGILLNAWSTTVDVGTENVPVTATIWNACEDGYSDSTTVTVQQGEQGGDEPFIELLAGGEEPTLFSSGGGKGDCAPGYHREGDSCVKNLAATIAGGSESTGVEGADGTTTDEASSATGQDGTTGDGDLLTGAVTGGGFGSWTWLLALLALIAALLGYAYYKYE